MTDDRDARMAQLEAEVASLRADAERRDRALAEALEQQTATAEVLGVIASAPTDLERVLQTIVDTAARLCNAQSAIVQELRERDVHLVPRAAYGVMREMLESTWGHVFSAFDKIPGLPARRENL